MFGWGLTFLSALVTVYLAWRTSTVPWLARRVAPRTMGSAWAILWGLMTLGRQLGHAVSFPGAGPLERLGMTLLGLVFLCFLPLAVVDLATGFGRWGRAASPHLRGHALCTGLLLTGLASVQGLRAPEVVEYEVSLAGLPAALDGRLVVALSDLHLGATLGPGWLAARLAEVQSLRPDLVVLLGDVFEGHGRPDEHTIALLRSLRAPLGVWAVDGNHEQHGASASPLDDAGARVLRNAVAVPAPGLVLTGRSEPSGRSRGTAPAWCPPTGRPEGALILLAHIPRQTAEAARSGVGLMLSGHTHGGQLWPFGYLVGLAYPTQAGLERIEGMTLIVHRGTGTWGPRMRLWQRAEISRIRLRSPISLAASQGA